MLGITAYTAITAISANIKIQHPGDHEFVGTSTFTDALSVGTTTQAKSANAGTELYVAGTTPELRVGDTEAEDSSIVFDGNAQDFYILLDDTDDDLKIGTESAGANPAIKIAEDRSTTFGGSLSFNSVTYIDDTTPDCSTATIILLGSNTMSTAITDLDNPVVGSIVTLITVGGANYSTIADSGNFNIAGSGGWAPDSADDNISFYIQADNDYVQLFGTQTNN